MWETGSHWITNDNLIHRYDTYHKWQSYTPLWRLSQMAILFTAITLIINDNLIHRYDTYHKWQSYSPLWHLSQMTILFTAMTLITNDNLIHRYGTYHKWQSYSQLWHLSQMTVLFTALTIITNAVLLHYGMHLSLYNLAYTGWRPVFNKGTLQKHKTNTYLSIPAHVSVCRTDWLILGT